MNLFLLQFKLQSLWHLRRFREEFLRRSTSAHRHVGDPCVTCALYEIFIALNTASMETRGESVAPTSLRIALSNLYPDSSFFQEVYSDIHICIKIKLIVNKINYTTN